MGSLLSIAVKEPGRPLERRQLANELKAFQDIVGGYIEVVHLPHEILLVCNEDGKLLELPPNIPIAGNVIVGTVIFCSSAGSEFASLSDVQYAFLQSAIS